MATKKEIEAKIRAFTRELADELEEVSWEDDFVSPFAAIESQGAQLGDLLAQELGAQMSRKQNEKRLPDSQCACPQCRSPGDLKKLLNREIQTTRGTTELTEPEYYCKKCRRSFFPSDLLDRS